MAPAAPVLPAPPALAPVVRAVLADLGKAPANPALVVHPADEMLGHLTALSASDRDQALGVYYRTGHSVADTARQVLAWHFGERLASIDLLDFASGYGRVTRFLRDHLGAGRLWISDVYDGAVEFQRQALGVHAFPSALRPEELVCERTFDAILVVSLFTHLPEARFRGWLRTLLGLLRPGGLLLFSTHGLAAAVVKLPPEQRFLFQPLSESGSLDTADYGSTFVADSWVAQAIEELAPGASVRRLPRALCDFQDLWVVAPQGAALETLALDVEPGWEIEKVRIEADGTLEIGGWVDLLHGEVKEVEAEVDGVRIGACTLGGERPELAIWRGPGSRPRTFSCVGRLPAGTVRERCLLLLRLIDRRGVRHPVFAGRLEAARIGVLERQVAFLSRRVEVLEETIQNQAGWAEAEIAQRETINAAMAASGFWKARNAWFAVKRFLRLSDEV